MTATSRVGELDAGHRPRVAEILRATGVFRDAEVDVALELFDEAFGRGRGTGDEGRAEFVPRSSSLGDGVASPDYTFLGAFAPDGRLLGYTCYGPTPGTDHTYDLYWIAVDPAAQGTGTGTLLLGEVERRLAAVHGRLLVIETSSRPEYAATRAFYQARSYDEAARVGSFYAPDDDRVIYTKRVQAALAGAE